MRASYADVPRNIPPAVSSSQFAFAQCDYTQPSQIFQFVCPPSPPPPVAVVTPPCNNGPVMITQTAANGQQLCMTAPSGSNLNLQPCTTSPSQVSAVCCTHPSRSRLLQQAATN